MLDALQGFLSIPTFFRFKGIVSGPRMDLFEAMMQFMNTGMFVSNFQNGNISHWEYTKQN